MIDFDELYQSYAADVHRFAFWLSGDAGIAEEATAETFARAWTHHGTLRLPTVKAYLLAIARNVVRGHYRRSRHSAELDEQAADPTPDAQRSLLGREALASVQRAFGSLPEKDRAAFLLRVEHELPYAEIATTLGISLSAAKVKVHRARLRLSAALTEEDNP